MEFYVAENLITKQIAVLANWSDKYCRSPIDPPRGAKRVYSQQRSFNTLAARTFIIHLKVDTRLYH